MINKLKKLIVNPIWIMVVFGFLIMSFATTGTTILFEYDSDAFSNDVATLYCDYGEGFSESQSNYSVINGNTVTFPLKDYKRIKQLRFVPFQESGIKVQLISCEIRTGIFKIKDLSTGQLINCLTEPFKQDYKNGRLSLEKIDDGMNYYLDFSKTLLESEKYGYLKIMESLRKAFSYIVLILGGMLVYWKGYNNQIEEKYLKITYWILGAGVFAEYLIAVNLPWWIAVIGFWVLLWGLGKQGFFWKCGKISYINLLFLILYTSVTAKTVIQRGILFEGYLIQQFLILLLLIGILNQGTDQEVQGYRNINLNVTQYTFLYAEIVAIYVSFSIMKNVLLNNNYYIGDALCSGITQIALINISWMFFFASLLYFLLGNGITKLFLGLFWIILFGGNYIKITYHDTFLTPMDFWQIRDMLRISQSVIGEAPLFVGMIVILLAIILIIKFRHRIGAFLRPHISAMPAVCIFFIVFFFTTDLLKDRYFADYNIGYKWYVTEYVGEDTSGTYLYNMFNVAHVSDTSIKKPTPYTEEYANHLKQEFETSAEYKVSDIKPNIICIMAESLFDIENIHSLTFNQEIEPTIHKNMKSTLISPRFGGYTAAVEYEALTGHSLYFYKEGTMPYTTYYTGRAVNSVASELKKSGYETLAFHPNTGSFYARQAAYNKMDFDKMYTISDLIPSKDELTVAGYYRDIPFAQKVIDIVDAAEDPVFLFGVSIAAHYTNEDHYPYTDITVDGNGLTDEEKHVIEQTAAAYQESDEMVRMLMEYVDNCEKPTMLYIFGDHLPPLNMYDKLSYIDDPVNKYGTVLLGYSNFKDIEFPEYMTPNQLGPQMLLDAEVKHSGYWDYIYSLRKRYPVIQKEFISDNDSENLEKYRFIQYDLMFGKKWLLERE